MATQLNNMEINFLKNEPTLIINKINKEINNKIKFNMEEITGKNVIFSSSAHRQPIIEHTNSHNFNIEHIKTIKEKKLIVAIDSSCIPIYDLDNGTIYASRVTAVLSLNGKPIKYLQFGPFLNYYNENTLNQFQFIKLNYFNNNKSSVIESHIRNTLERILIKELSNSLNNCIILIDGTLNIITTSEDTNTILKISNKNNNSLIGISKTTNDKSIIFTFPKLKSINGSPFIYKIKSNNNNIIKKELMLLKLRDNGLVFKTESISKDIKLELGYLSFNDSYYRGYPESLRLAHNISIFTNFENICFKSYLQKNFSVKEVPSENTRETILRWYWTLKNIN